MADIYGETLVEEQHRLLYTRRRFYDEPGTPQCSHKCIVAGTVCVCELVFGHEPPCERIPTMRLANVDDYQRHKQYRYFAEE